MKRYESDVYEDGRQTNHERMAWHDGFGAGVTWGFVVGSCLIGILWLLT